MRLLALILLVLTASAGLTSAATRTAGAAGGTLEITDGRGSVQITATGVIVGRLDNGSLKIVDLTPKDQWSPWVNGVPRGKVVWLKGRNISFRISAGRYRIVANGSGISVSARGTGKIVLRGDPDAVGDAGSFRVGDSPLVPVSEETTKTSFGATTENASSSRSVKIT